MAEEIFSNIKSNNQIYVNEHLTPYNSALFLTARRAKKDGKLASATSHGGRIRVRKNADDAPTVVTNNYQLQQTIDMEIDAGTEEDASSAGGESFSTVPEGSTSNKNNMHDTTNSNRHNSKKPSNQRTNSVDKSVESRKRKKQFSPNNDENFVPKRNKATNINRLSNNNNKPSNRNST